jgi:methylglutaconyl-CoA hydratase
VISHKIGKQKMFEMTWNPNQWFDVNWAKNCGLINEIVLGEELMQKGKEKALELVKYNPEALYALKEITWKGKENWEEIMTKRAMLSGTFVLSNFTREQLQKFKEKK